MNLSDKAFLVKVSIGTFDVKRKDDSLSAVALNSIHASSRAGNFNKNRFDPKTPEYDKALSLHRKVRAVSDNLTSPWADGGYRVITSGLFLRWKMETDAAMAEAEKALDELCVALPRIRQDTRGFLNGGYRDDEFPGEAEVRRAFYVERQYQPLPNTQDWRLTVGEAEAEFIRQEAEDLYKRQYEQAQVAAVDRLKGAVSHMAARLKEYQPDPSTGRYPRLFESVVGNVKELVGILPDLNLTGDAQFDRMIAECRAHLCRYTTEELKQSDATRINVQREAENILKGLEGLIA